MNKFEEIGTCKPEMLIADSKFPTDVLAVKIAATAAGVKVLKRGTILAYVVADDNCVVLGAESDAAKYASYILAEDVTTSETEEVVAEAYQTGKFVKNALIVDEGYSLGAADEKSLRDGGIYLQSGIL